MRRARSHVYQNIASLTAIDSAAAKSAMPPGCGMFRYEPLQIFSTAPQPISRPIAARTPPRISPATHSSRSCP